MQHNLQQSQNLLLKQTLSLKQIQYLQLLAMNVTELGDYLNSVYEENPVVELSSGSTEVSESGLDFFSWLSSSRELHSPMSKDDEGPSEITPKGQILDEKQNLFSHLRSQFDFSLREFDISLLDILMASLDKRGYLICDEEKIAKKGYDLELVYEAISYLQSLDPAGIAARNLSECLSLQLERQGETDPDAYKIVNEHLEDISKGYFQKIAKVLGCDDDKVRRIYAKIKTLNPIPASGFGSETPFSYIIPDVTIINDDNGLFVRYNKDFESKVSINKNYVDLAQSDKEAEKYIKEKTNQALWVMKALDSRRDTIERIVSCIIKTQEDFFTKAGDLKPLKLKDIAKELNIHESTVSRAVNEKYLECRRGIFPLKYFFSGEVTHAGESSEGALSAETLRKRIAEIIEGEDKKKPYSDSSIIKILASDGIMIARRTVAKYRDEMGIPASSIRKEK